VSESRKCPICENKFTQEYLIHKGLKRKIRKALRILWSMDKLMLMCYCCQERFYYWKHHDKHTIPYGWIEDLEMNHIVKKNLKKIGIIKTEALDADD
jgi:hypothetical protein